MQQLEMEMRKRVVVKVGDKLLFSPSIQATVGEDGDFFHKYNGMTAEVLGFDESGFSMFLDRMADAVGREKSEKRMDRFFVRFENGDEPKHSVYYVHFIVE